MTHLLIDADLLLYKAAIGSEYSCDWGGGNWVLSANLHQAEDAILSRIEGMQFHFNPSGRTLVRSDRENFRKQLFPEYKGDRADTRKPIIFNQLVEWLDEQGCIHYPKLEADDTLGILHTSGQHKDSIIISEDKDMMTIPGKLYRGGELLTITPEQAQYHHMYQTLTGDTTDGYSGCPGIGPKTAEKLLQGDPKGFWGVVVQAYLKAEMTEEDALLNARMAYILQSHNWKDNEVILWTPPS